MNFKYIALLFVGFACLLASCNDDTENVVSAPSKDAQISSLAIKAVHNKEIKDSLERATDSLRFIVLGKTKFAIDQVNNLIYNPDSLPFGTILKKVSLTLAYKGSPNNVEIELKDSTYNWNSTDSVDFSKRPIKLNVSAGGLTKRYTIDIRTHKVDPDLLIWNYIRQFGNSGERKTVLFQNQFYSFLNNSGLINIVEILDPKNPTSLTEKAVSGLPSDVKTESLTTLNNALFIVANDGKSYTSENGTTWTEQSNGKTVANILGVIPGVKSSDDQLLVLINDGGAIFFGNSKDLSSVNKLVAAPANFPVKGFASTTNYSGDKKNNMLLVSAGADNAGNAHSATWWLKFGADADFQFVQSKNTDKFEGVGLSSFFYDKKLYIFSKKEFYISSDWGLNWVKAPEKQALASTFGSRLHQSVLVVDNKIWILGGVSEGNSYFRDIWSGKLNSLK